MWRRKIYIIITGLYFTWIFPIIIFYNEKPRYKQNTTWSLKHVNIRDYATLPPSTTCGISFSLPKFSSMFFWLLSSTGSSSLIGIFNVMILYLKITSTFADLILPSLFFLMSSTIFPIPQSQCFNTSSWMMKTPTLTPTISPTLVCKTYFLFLL